MINGYDSIGGIILVISYVRLVTCLVSLSIVLLLSFKDISLSGNGHFKNFQVYFFLIKSRNDKFRFAHAKNRSFETTMS